MCTYKTPLTLVDTCLYSKCKQTAIKVRRLVYRMKEKNREVMLNLIKSRPPKNCIIESTHQSQKHAQVLLKSCRPHSGVNWRLLNLFHFNLPSPLYNLLSYLFFLFSRLFIIIYFHPLSYLCSLLL